MFRASQYQANESGFTLVELLVVIAIIAILTAIAVPSFLSQREKANVAALRSDMKNIATAIETEKVERSGGTFAISHAPGVATITFSGPPTKSIEVKLSKGTTDMYEDDNSLGAYSFVGTTRSTLVTYASTSGGFLS